jgi:hypothetical protein
MPLIARVVMAAVCTTWALVCIVATVATVHPGWAAAGSVALLALAMCWREA